MKRTLLLTLIGLLVGGAVMAEPRFRADDGNFWHLNDNPALPAVSGDVLAMGAAVSSVKKWADGTRDLQLVSPLVSFRYQWSPLGDATLGLGTALGPWEGLSFGYRTDETTRGQARATAHQFGALYRPLDLVSAAATVDDAFGAERRWGAGVALRPLTLWSPAADWLTLSADGNWRGSNPRWEQVGAKVAWGGSDVRLWYTPGAKVPGFEVTLALGPAETSAGWSRVGQAVRWSTRTPELTGFGPLVLRLKGTGALTSAPQGQGAWFANASSASVPEWVALLDRAADNPSVKAVAFEDPPVVGGLASAEDLRQALLRLQKAGKKVYFYADSYDDSKGFQGWIATGDRVSLHPTGSLWLTAGGSRRLYLKDALDKVGVHFVNFAPWETKSANNTLTFASMPAAERAMVQRFLTDEDALAQATLQSGRGSKLKKPAAELVAGGPWLVADEALRAGLVDAVESRSTFEDLLTTEFPGANLVDTLPAPRPSGWGPSVAAKTVALVHLSGDIVAGPGQAAQSIGSAAAEAIAALRDQGDIRAIVLRVDSPGGSVTPSDILADEVRLTVEAGKPVVVLMGDLAASGGYYLSAPASRIYAQPGTLTGSIGVTAAWFSAEKTLDLLGIHADGVDLAPSTGFGDWTRPLAERDGQKWSGMIQATYQRFLDVVAAGRHLDKDRLEPLARGQVYTGREALALGLVDELGGQAEAKAWLEKELSSPVTFVDVVPGDSNPWSAVLGPLAKAVVAQSDSATLRLAAALDPLAAPVADALAGVAARGPGPLVWADLR